MSKIKLSQLVHFNEELNVSLTDARKARQRLQQLGFFVTAISGSTISLPPGMPSGSVALGIEVSEAELIEIVGTVDTPVFLNFDLAGNAEEDRIEVARVIALLGPDNDISDVQRLSNAINPGKQFAWMEHLFQIPGIVQAVNGVLQTGKGPVAPPQDK